jgi:carbamoylphosphate synthase large subunit
MTAIKKAVRERKTTVPVSELNLRKAATRLLATKLVSTEIAYIQRELGSSATQEDLDAKVVKVREMPWSSIVEPE